MLGTYAVINGNDNGWTSGEPLGLLAAAAALLVVFLAIEARISSPLMPLGLFACATSPWRMSSASCRRGLCWLVLPLGALSPARARL
jgi:hypothetical protein